MSRDEIIIRGAREHNLRDVSLRLPKNKLIVMTGVSGSGKSSLAFDTLYAEGQRRYVESLSTYARQFLGQMPRPDVDSISGLSPSISIQQKATSRNPRSTVGTITEIYDYLRVLFARVGQGYCYVSGRPIQAQSTDQILESISRLPERTRFQILAPVIQQQKGEFRDLFEDLLKRGYLRARVDGEVVSLADNLQLKRHHKHTIEVVIDRLVSGSAGRTRLAEAVENAIRLSNGTLIRSQEIGGRTDSIQTIDRLYSANYACPESGMSYEPPTPQLFSFNSPLGMCPDCNGLGMRHEFVLGRMIDSENKSIAKGALRLLGPLRKIGRWRRHIFHGVARAIEQDLDLPRESFLKTPWGELSEKARHMFLYGTGDRHITFSWPQYGAVYKHGGTWSGFITQLLDDYRRTRSPMRRRQLEKYMDFLECSGCHGARLNRQARHVRITSKGRSFARRGRPMELNLPQVCALSIEEASEFFESLDLDETGQLIAAGALNEIRGRLGFLLRCGLNYLTLDRSAPSLSGGESQRIRLAGQIGCGLVGVVYILDEPSIGLHPRDNGMLLESLCRLRDQGNTVIVVEHDEETMHAADHIVDFGPGPGVRGGKVVAKGKIADISSEQHSLTGDYLSRRKTIAVPAQRRSAGKKTVKVVGARHNNLQNIDVTFPLRSFICVTGVSGSGKSSLINDILWQVLNRDVNRGRGLPGRHRRVNGLQHVDRAIDIDQSPIGRTPRSNPATYVKVFDLIRDLFAKLPGSRMRGYRSGRFSFNVAGGRCEACEGYGATKLEMDFLADVWVRCPVCEGRRFNHETLEVRFKDRNIADVLNMDVQEALEHFENVPKISRLLDTLHDVGLDYLKLGQPSPTLSGGEAQRIKLARELGKRSTGNTFYLLDEPTTGLHFADVQKLLDVLQGFVDAGNTVLIVEHHLDVIKTADWIIDLGPEGGAGGGRIVAQGTPEQIAACSASHTGQALRGLPDLVPAGRTRPVRRRKSLTQRPQHRPASGRWQINLDGLEANGRPVRDIVIRGAGQHNLQDIDVTLPRDRMSVFCGPSGSGKSSLAMDTLYAEGQRRYVESLSAYARQFLGQMPKPRVEHIYGLSPAIAIEQKTVGQTPRSTVGTVTEIHDYLRILFARLGQRYCPDCNLPVTRQTTDEIVKRVMANPDGSRLVLLAPIVVPVGRPFAEQWERLRSQGFVRVRIDGRTHDLESVPDIDHRRAHVVEVVIDRISVTKRSRSRIADSIEAALDVGRGVIGVAHVDPASDESDWKVARLSLDYSCPGCDRSFEELTPQSFSFNSVLGWCPGCEGLGIERGTNLATLIADPTRSLSEGAVTAWPNAGASPMFQQMLESLAEEFAIPLDVPYYQLDPRHQRLILYGTGDRSIEMRGSGFRFRYKGLYPALEEASRVSYAYRQTLHEMVGEKDCSSCDGGRLRDDAAAVRLKRTTLPQLCRLPLVEALTFLKGLRLRKSERDVAGDLLSEAVHRLTFLVNVGLHYLSLDRSIPTLSGGESQRIRLAGQIGRSLTGVLYVLDEPTIGLHPRDNGRLLSALRRLRDLGNTVVLVEHDREVLEAADRLYEFGPGAGRSGGTIVASGTPKQIGRQSRRSLTGGYLTGSRCIPVPISRRMDSVSRAPIPPGNGWLEILGATQNNLRRVDLRLPLGTMTCVTGVSGSGKSSLLEETLARAVARKLHRSSEVPGPYGEMRGVERISKVIVVDQQPIGNTPASNPATYTGVFEHIRDLFSRMPHARVRGYRPGRFSFNRAGGRCDDCEGMGQKKIEMHFLPDVWVQCTTCRGRRYNQETLAVTWRNRSIADVLEMSIGQAQALFENIPKIRGPLETLAAIGLEYLTLGQPAPTLSGGEAQRIKLASELARPNTGRTLYLLDEPTTGLHFDDVAKLLKVLNSLVEQGNTVVVIEHNLDVIKTADWIVDLGPDAGVDGGWIVAQGTPEDVVSTVNRPDGNDRRTPVIRSYTAELLAPLLKSDPRAERDVFNAAQATRQRDGDLDLRQVGRDAKLPWQRDGRRWHTSERVSYSGHACRWEGAALEFVIGRLENDADFASANWGHRTTVEVMSASKTGGWFLHALTGDEWLLTLTFRVKKNTFRRDALDEQLGLRPVDDIDELPVYGRSDRVRVKNERGPWQKVTITVHWLKEIDTAGFKRFLKDAIRSYIEQARAAKINPDDLTPWKVLGRKWHLSRKGFPSHRRIRWDASVLENLTKLLDSLLPDAEVDWSNKQVVYFRRAGEKNPLVELHTKRRGGVDLTIITEPGRIAFGRIAELGAEREIAERRTGERVRIRFDGVRQVRSSELKTLLSEIRDSP